MKVREILISFLFYFTVTVVSEEQSFSTSKIPQKDLHDYCADFLDCENEMMNIHQRCTEKSRKATATACGLEKDFLDLNELMEIRISEFAICVSNETDLIENDFERFENFEIPFETCVPVKSDKMNQIMEADGCWKAVAAVKQQCQQLQKCCPAAKICTKSGKNSEPTKNVRNKHIDINRKTLECRNKMKKILEGKNNSTDSNDTNIIKKAHAVLTAQGFSNMDTIQKKYFFNKKESQDLVLLKNHVTRLNSVITTTSLPPTTSLQLHKESEVIQRLVYNNNHRGREGIAQRSGYSNHGRAEQREYARKPDYGNEERVEQLEFARRPPYSDEEGNKQKHFSSRPIHNNPERSHELGVANSNHGNPKQRQFASTPVRNNLPTIESLEPLQSSSNRQLPVIKEAEVIQRLVYHNNRRPKVLKQFGRNPGIFTTPKKNIQTTKQKINIELEEVTEPIRPHITTTASPRGFTKKFFDENSTPSISGVLVDSDTSNTPHISDVIQTTSKKPSIDEIRLRQAKEFKDLIRSLELEARTTTVSPFVNRNNAELPRNPTGIFYSNYRQKGILPRLKALQQRTSFAIPQNFNLKQTHIFEARPFLKQKNIKTGDSQNLNPLGRRIAVNDIKKDVSQKAKAHSIKTQTDVEKPILNIFYKKSNNANEAFVNENGAWTMEPNSEKDYPEYDATVSPDRRKEKEFTRTTMGNIPRGYRNKLLAAWKTTTAAPALLVFTKDSEQLAPLQDYSTESSGEIDFTFERTTISPSTTPSTTATTRISSTRPPTTKRPVIPPSVHLTRKEEAELLVVKSELITNLEEYLKKHQKEIKKKTAQEKQKKRLLQLRKSKQEYTTENKEMSYCHLYSVCSEELKYIQKSCEVVDGRLIPGLPRRRFGECNRKLVTEFKTIDRLKKKIEKEFETCLTFKVLESDSFTSLDTCPIEWPVLPEIEYFSTCSQKVRIVQNHCSKLGRCCSAVQECREETDESESSMALVEKEEEILKKSAKCQIRAFNDYKKFRSRSRETVTPTIATTTTTPQKYITPELVFPTLISINQQEPQRDLAKVFTVRETSNYQVTPPVEINNPHPSSFVVADSTQPPSFSGFNNPQPPPSRSVDNSQVSLFGDPNDPLLAAFMKADDLPLSPSEPQSSSFLHASSTQQSSFGGISDLELSGFRGAYESQFPSFARTDNIRRSPLRKIDTSSLRLRWAA